MKKRTLNDLADRIEATLARHRVPGRVTGGTLAPRRVQFQALLSAGADPARVERLAHPLALALGAEACRVTCRGGTALIEIPRPDPRPVGLLGLQRRVTGPEPLPFGTALLGLAEDGAPLLARLPSPQVAHLFVAGLSGAGKTALAQTAILSLALGHRPRDLGFILIDPGGGAFERFSGLPHLLRPVLDDPRRIRLVLRDLARLEETRDREGRRAPRVVVVIDDLARLLSTGGRPVYHALERLARRGREAGIHLLLCTGTPTGRAVQNLIRGRFPLRLVGQVACCDEARAATGYAGTGAERLHGQGDFIAVTGGEVTRFQAAYVAPRELISVVARMNRSNDNRPLPVPVTNQPLSRARRGVPSRVYRGVPSRASRRISSRASSRACRGGCRGTAKRPGLWAALLSLILPTLRRRLERTTR